MPKFSGLSHLADVAREQMEDVHCYPVRRRGSRRQLLPNQDGIDWLEGKVTDGENFQQLTEVCGETEVEEDGIIFTRAAGADERDYSRPMFQLIYDGNFSGSKLPVQPCEACDNFAYSWGCDVHPAVPWDTERRRWVKPCTDLPSCDCTPCYVERRDRRNSARRLREGSATGIVSDFAQHLLSYARDVQPVERRANVHPYGFEVHDVGDVPDGRRFFDEAVMERHRRRDQEDRYLTLPDFTGVLEAERRRQAARYLTLPDFTGTLEGTWRIDDDMGQLRISGESEQGIDSFTIEIEGGRRG